MYISQFSQMQIKGRVYVNCCCWQFVSSLYSVYLHWLVWEYVCDWRLIPLWIIKTPKLPTQIEALTKSCICRVIRGSLCMLLAKGRKGSRKQWQGDEVICLFPKLSFAFQKGNHWWNQYRPFQHDQYCFSIKTSLFFYLCTAIVGFVLDLDLTPVLKFDLFFLQMYNLFQNKTIQ